MYVIISIVIVLIIFIFILQTQIQNNKSTFLIAHGTLKSHNTGDIIDTFKNSGWKLYIEKPLEKYYLALNITPIISTKNEFIKGDLKIPIYFYGKFSKQKALETIEKLPHLVEVENKDDLKFMPMGRIRNLIHVEQSNPLYVYYLIRVLKMHGWELYVDDSQKSKEQLKILFNEHKLDHYKYFIKHGNFMWKNKYSGDKFSDLLSLDQILNLYYFKTIQ